MFDFLKLNDFRVNWVRKLVNLLRLGGCVLRILKEFVIFLFELVKRGREIKGNNI